MLIKTLVENTSYTTCLGAEHGLSLYLETHGYKIMFDLGAGDLFLKNAGKLQVDIADIDYLVISHGHADHGGGLRTFLQHNHKAEVFIHPLAFEKHEALDADSQSTFIGLDDQLRNHRQITLTSDSYFISKGIYLFTSKAKIMSRPQANTGLLVERRGRKQADSFEHEQNLVVEEPGQSFLLTGCAHRGIINIIEDFRTRHGHMPDYLIGGFHLSRSRSGRMESLDVIDQICTRLLDDDIQCYTGHCTGLEVYHYMKEKMGKRIDCLWTGCEINIISQRSISHERSM